MVEILTATLVPGAFRQVEEIFWETSARTAFGTGREKIEFQERYLNLYTRDYPQHVFVAVEDGLVLGYVLGVTNTLKAAEILAANPHLSIFDDMFERYPAHLHINFRAEARGKGIGSELINAFERYLKAQGVQGLHLITSATARNVSFYAKNDFLHRVERLWNGRPLLLLGKTLQA